VPSPRCAPPPAVSVGAAMIHRPKTCGPATTVAQARAFFRNDHVHALLVVEGEVLVSAVERGDLAGAPAGLAVAVVGCLEGRTTPPTYDADDVLRCMAAAGRRRLAVVGDDGELLGLLCLKRSRRGFCSDEGVAARRREQAARPDR
jgi:CBS domain-containing protein